MKDKNWLDTEQATIPSLLEARLDSDPDGEYLDVCGTKLSASDVARASASTAAALHAWGLQQGDRVAILTENSPEAVLAWWGVVRAGGIAVPINTAYKGAYLTHQLSDSGARVLVVEHDLLDRAIAALSGPTALHRIVVIESARSHDADDAWPTAAGVELSRWSDLIAYGGPAPQHALRPADTATFIYTGGTTGPSKGCILSHAYHGELARQIGICWQRTRDDVLWTPLPLFHFNALVTAVLGALAFGGRSAIYRRFSVSNFWPEVCRVEATIACTLGTMAYLLAQDSDRDEMPRSATVKANSTLRLLAAAPLPVEIDQRIRSRFGIETFSGAYGVTEASLISWQPANVTNRANAAGVVNDEYFDVRIFDDDDRELPCGADGEIVVRPKRPNVMFDGYWGRPEATVETSRNWWYHTGDIGRIDDDGYLYFVDRKADYLRRRGENISSYEVESVLMRHPALADVAVHAVPSELTEDDLKLTAILNAGHELDESALFRWCIEELPYFALPRYIEFRETLPRSPLGRVLKRELRSEGVTAQTWDAERSGIKYEKR